MEQKSFSKLSSDTISALRFPLMVGIVFIHFNVLEGVTVQGVEYGANPPFWLVCINNMFSDVFPRIGVPLFFLMSGYLFFWSGLTKDSYQRKLKKRARTLLVPYIIWNAVALLYGAMRTLPCFKSIFPNAVAHWSVGSFLSTFWGTYHCGVFYNPTVVEDTTRAVIISPQDGPMWYVRNLMIAVLLSPLFYVLMKRFKHWLIWLLGIAWCITVANATRDDLMYQYQVFTTPFFFGWGAYYAIEGIDLVALMRRFRLAPWFYLPVAIADMLTKEWAYNGYIHNIGIVLGIFTAVSLTSILLEKGKIKVNKFLAESSFFIFALHIIFIGDIGKVLVKLCFIDSYIYMAALYFLVPTVDICICLGAYWLLRRYTPRLCALLTGGR